MGNNAKNMLRSSVTLSAFSGTVFEKILLDLASGHSLQLSKLPCRLYHDGSLGEVINCLEIDSSTSLLEVLAVLKSDIEILMNDYVLSEEERDEILNMFTDKTPSTNQALLSPASTRARVQLLSDIEKEIRSAAEKAFYANYPLSNSVICGTSEFSKLTGMVVVIEGNYRENNLWFFLHTAEVVNGELSMARGKPPTAEVKVRQGLTDEGNIRALVSAITTIYRDVIANLRPHVFDQLKQSGN